MPREAPVLLSVEPELHRRTLGPKEVLRIVEAAEWQAGQQYRRGNRTGAENLLELAHELGTAALEHESADVLLYGTEAGGCAAFGPVRLQWAHGLRAERCEGKRLDGRPCWCRNLGARRGRIAILAEVLAPGGVC